MSEAKWSDSRVDRCLRSLSFDEALPGAPTVSPDLRARTRAAWQTRRASVRRKAALWKGAVVVAAAICLLLVTNSHSTMADVAELILGIPVRVLNMSREEWLRQGFSNWLAKGPDTAFLSPEETAEIAPFPIRTPAWLPEGFAAIHEPTGAYSWGHYPDEGWKVVEDDRFFFVTQSFQSEDGRQIGIIQSIYWKTQAVDLPPDTEILEVVGHPAFLRRDVPYARADEENELRSKSGLLPEIVGYRNELELWVSEADGQITQIHISGDVSPEVLVGIAESLFEEGGGEASPAP